eukprot:gnl/MRDRNA2_/MRDRNA2_28727_c0_seq1.p1 gnl/MRDRNA2_/MRDRNA2_28727_c0~~gnl/MRDRNA2_/MRDRNA2_28727_c0_seq1.p1  ORF type:complete len:257 (-),score=48.45 gnl/MRDRNA2_/MRDRNA2_28727_c0_seq1:21-719(-)
MGAGHGHCRGCNNETVDENGFDIPPHQRAICPGEGGYSSWIWEDEEDDDRGSDQHEEEQASDLALRHPGLENVLAEEDRKLRQASEKEEPKGMKVPQPKDQLFPGFGLSAPALSNSPSFFGRTSSFYSMQQGTQSSGMSSVRASTFDRTFSLGPEKMSFTAQQKAATFNGSSFMMERGIPKSLSKVNLGGLYGLAPSNDKVDLQLEGARTSAAGVFGRSRVGQSPNRSSFYK